jgi:lipopolysaccharide transport system permease protein
MAGELVAARHLLASLVLRDVRVRYRQTLLGFVWAVAVPVAVVAVFVLLRGSGVLALATGEVPYVVFALAGLTVWQVFGGGLVACTGALVASGSMVAHLGFPRESLVLAAFGQVVLDTAVRAALLGAALAWYGVVPSPAVVLLPLALLPLAMLTVGLGLVLSLLNAVARDVAQAVAVLMPFLMLLSPVLYPQPETGPLAAVMRASPLTILVELPRRLVLGGAGELLGPFAAVSAASLFVLLIGWRLFHVAQPRIAERIGGR